MTVTGKIIMICPKCLWSYRQNDIDIYVGKHIDVTEYDKCSCCTDFLDEGSRFAIILKGDQE